MMKSRAKTLATAAALAGVPVPAKVPTTTVKSIPAVRQQTANATYNQSLRADPEKHTHRLLTKCDWQNTRRHSLKSAKPSAATESELRDAMAAAAKEVHRAEGLLERDSSNRARAAITPRHMTTRANEIRRQAKDSIESHESLTAPVDAASTDWDRELRRALMEKDAAGGDSCAWCANPSQRARWNALLLFSKSMLAIPLGLPCKVCNESWPATEMGRRATVFDATTDTCKRCDLDMGEVKKYSKENDMDPGDIPDHLPELTVVEEALIATAHQHIQVMRNTGGSAKYRGHTCVFEQEIGAFLTTLPPRLNELNILLVRKSSDDGSFSKVFRVRRDAVFQWLTFLKANHPAYREVTIDLANLNLLPGDDYVGDRLPQVLDDDELEPAAAVPAAGMAPAQPPGGGLPPDESGVISLKAGAMENAALLNTLRRAQLGIRQDDPSLPRDAVAWPTHGPDPMNEFTQYDLMARVFPTLFPTGVCMFVPADGRRHDVKFASYVLHLLRHKSRRFAQHPRWRYTVLNQQLRWQALTSSRVFVAREQQHLTLDQLADAVARGDNSVSGGLQRFASKLRGTDGFWRSNKAKGYAFMAFLEYFFDRMPTTFTTISGAEVHWRWFHRLLHGSDAYLDPLAEPMDPSAEFKLRAELVALNPALSAWGFHHMTNEWFKHVLYKHGNFVDHMSRTEFAKRGMPHKHVLAVLKDALTAKILLAVGARVMLRTNLWTAHGLTNGALGTVVAIVYAHGEHPLHDDLPQAVVVDFDHYTGPSLGTVGTRLVPVCAQKVHSDNPRLQWQSRVQMPLMLGFASTIHKAQGCSVGDGQTLTHMTVDLGSREYCAGLTYVACSRAMALHNIAFETCSGTRFLPSLKPSAALGSRLYHEQQQRTWATSTIATHTHCWTPYDAADDLPHP